MARYRSIDGRTPAEREPVIIEHVAAGDKNIDIAHVLGTTEYVVKNDLRLIYDRLGLWNRVELALWFTARQFEKSHVSN